MLGGEQSGHIEAVGFEMYTSMLEEAVSEMKGEEHPRAAGTRSTSASSLRIDESYIAEENQRLRIYKRIAGAQDDAALDDVRAEMEDRYGELPASVLHLLEAAACACRCERLGVSQVDRKRDQIQIRFTGQASIDPGRLMKLVAQKRQEGRSVHAPGSCYVCPLRPTEPRDVLRRDAGLSWRRSRPARTLKRHPRISDRNEVPGVVKVNAWSHFDGARLHRRRETMFLKGTAFRPYVGALQ